MSQAHFTERGNAPYRYDVVGSFLRPERLKKARADFENGTVGRDELKAVEDECIAELVRKQKAAGLRCVTDGEFRRSWWHFDFMWGFDGVERTPLDHGYQFHGEETRAETARLSGKISCGRHPFFEHFEYLSSVADGTPARQTMPAPAQFLAEIDRPENAESTKAVYPGREELLADIAQAWRDAIAGLYERGCRNVQLDDCTWGMFCDVEALKLIGIDEEQCLAVQEEYLALNNAVLEGWPDDLALTTHVCRGNYHSKHASEGGYAPVADVLLARENVDAFYLEFDDERSGDFSPLSRVAEGKLVVLGLVTTKDGALEGPEAVKARIEEASAIVPLDRLCLSPQCGFASTEEGNVLSEDEQWAKIALVRQIAEEVWGE